MKTVLPAAMFLTVLFSCQKSSDDIVKQQPAQKDFAGKYKVTKLLFQSKGNPDQDLLATLPNCAQDDLLVFAADSSFKKEDAGASCGEPAEEPAVWFIKDNNMYIDGVQSNIVSFDTHTLNLATAMVFLGVQGTVMETLVKQ